MKTSILACLLLICPFLRPGESSVTIPIGGNTWISGNAKVTEQGIEGWSDLQTVIHTYVWVAQAGSLRVALRNPEGKGLLRMTISSKSVEFAASKADQIGEWEITKPGYLRIDIQGIRKDGQASLGKLESLRLSGSAVNAEMAFVKDNEGNFFYWGRRGPSVHLNYPLPAEQSIEYFYNEITVPEGQDVIGSYYMAVGFGEGYFGIQVNSPTERRVLFSIWSPYQTDDPTKIPEDQKIKLLRKGSGVHVGEFGNEGSGGQSYLKYAWKAGQTYRFLVHGIPSEATQSTTYTAYFYSPAEKSWRLIASFERPHTLTYLKKFHSFLENFIPETGNQTRWVKFSNQWVKAQNGQWVELSEAKFTADATARKGYRLDYAGGVREDAFYLKNCGFFSETTPINTIFKRSPNGQKPVIGKLAY
ncbi:MAG: DUF3472 domain-containing protein [Siphonobacter sp.]